MAGRMDLVDQMVLEIHKYIYIYQLAKEPLVFEDEKRSFKAFVIIKDLHFLTPVV